MKYIKVKYNDLIIEQRWDIDYHIPPIEIKKYNPEIICKLHTCTDIITEKRNPTLEPDKSFIYIDISSVDVKTGIIITPQELIGKDAPSRDRKVVRAGDIIISTCRPTRGAIAVIPDNLDNQICSTGFSVIRAKDGVNNKYLHFILRSPAVKEQFRKFSTGSSYPAILDEDVKKTEIPLPNCDIQKKVADEVEKQTIIRNKAIDKANETWEDNINKCFNEIQSI